MSGKIPATLIPGDGIGPEIVKSAVDILEALGSPFEWDVRQGGLAAIEESRERYFILLQAILKSVCRERPVRPWIGGLRVAEASRWFA